MIKQATGQFVYRTPEASLLSALLRSCTATYYTPMRLFQEVHSSLMYLNLKAFSFHFYNH